MSNKYYSSPFQEIPPKKRWAPSVEELGEDAYYKLLPPLVQKIREEVKEWRENNYKGASNVSKDLLEFWFEEDHFKIKDGEKRKFEYYFAQREAVESIVYLYEVAKARDKYDLQKLDSSGRVTQQMFAENWSRYVIKMATGTGKTKVASLALAWAFFHKKYNEDSNLSTNFLIVAPNIIVLDRLRKDFENLSVFREDPVVPEDGYRGRNWELDFFKTTVHIQDNLKTITPEGNIFLTNRHRIGLYDEDKPDFSDSDVMDYFIGKKPKPGADKGGELDLGELLRGDKVKDLIVINDEAHGVREENKWFQNIEDINNQMKLKYDSGVSLQLDFSATPKDQTGAVFVQTICDYPLVEAIKQNVVKQPVLPDQASRGSLNEKETDDYVKRYEDHIRLGYQEWKQQYENLKNSGQIPKLFIMTTETSQSDEVANYLETHYPEMEDSVLVIHTKRSGEISEAKSKREQLNELRKSADRLDDPNSPYKAIVSVLMLREGWDVDTVTTIVGLRPYTHESKILPEQTIGRGLRKMFDFDTREKLSVVGTEAFLDFVESIKKEGVEFGYRKMGSSDSANSPVVVEPDLENKNKDLDDLDIEIPILTPRKRKEYKKLSNLKVDNFEFDSVEIKQFSKEEQREIVFETIEGERSHKTILKETALNYRNVIKFYTNSVLSKTRLNSGFDVLYPKVKLFIEQYLFGETVDLSDRNVIRNLSEPKPKNIILETFTDAINNLTITDKGEAEVKDYIKLRETKPKVTSRKKYLIPKKSIFNKIVGDNDFELEFAGFLEKASDVISFAKNNRNIGFKIEYVSKEEGIRDYYPDFIIKTKNKEIIIAETKGRKGEDVQRKMQRLLTWCKDVNKKEDEYTYFATYIQQKKWNENKNKLKTAKDILDLFKVTKK